METVFIAVSLALIAAAGLTYTAIAREVLPHLATEDRYALHHLFLNSKPQELRAGDRAIKTAWQTHVALFPAGRKRTVFAGFLIAAALSVFCYPLWLYFR